MTTTIEDPNKINNGRTMAGVIILVIGGLLLIDQLNILLIPEWLFSWPMWIIAYGLYMGGKYNFRKPVWAVMIVIGVAFLFTENIYHADRVVWPMAIIATGAWMINRNHHKSLTETGYKNQPL